MAKVRIVQSSWTTFTGEIGMTEFTDGLSVEDVPHRQISILASLFAIEVIAGEGEALPAHLEYARNAGTLRATAAPVLEELSRAPKRELFRERVKAKHEKIAEIERVHNLHTREQLEAIADDDGIKGLRLIAEPLGVRGKAIPTLIDSILAAEAQIRARMAMNADSTHPLSVEPTAEADVVVEGEGEGSAPEKTPEQAPEQSPEPPPAEAVADNAVDPAGDQAGPTE